MSDQPTTGIGHERRDVHFAPVLIGAALIVAMVLLAAGGMWLLHDSLAGREARRSRPANPLADSVGKVPPEPRLQADPAGDLQTLRTAEQAILEGYGWIDRDAGIARVPIDRAMDLVAAGRGRRLPEEAP